MQYVLGNMLNGAGGLNPDGLSLDLQFATDKTLTARKGPTPVFTRASTATFIGSNGLIQSAAINEARFDHNPVTLACKGLLIEESRTNLVFPSATLTTQTRTVTAVAHTLSFYGTGSVVLSGTHVATVTGTGAYPTRTTLTFTPTAGSLILTVTGSVTEAQLEAGSFPTSYIPTVASSVVRSVDVCSITSLSPWYNFTEGTMLAVFSGMMPDSLGGNRSIAAMSDGTYSNLISLAKTSNAASIQGEVTQIGTSQLAIARSGYVQGGTQKIALALADDNSAFSFNGTINTDNTVVLPTTLSHLRFRDPTGASAGAPSGHYQSFRYFRKRLPNAKLQALTA
jgi:hypothetical protein